MRVTNDIREAIRRTAEELGSNTALAERSGVHFSAIGKYLNAKTPTMTDQTWDRLHPHIKKHLPSNLQKQVGKSVFSKQEELAIEILEHGTDREKRILQEALNEVLIERASKQRAQ